MLREGDSFTIDANMNVDDGNQNQVGVTYKALAEDVKVGDKLLLDDGKLVFRIKEIADHQIKCEVIGANPDAMY